MSWSAIVHAWIMRDGMNAAGAPRAFKGRRRVCAQLGRDERHPAAGVRVQRLHHGRADAASGGEADFLNAVRMFDGVSVAALNALANHVQQRTFLVNQLCLAHPATPAAAHQRTL